MNFQGPNLGFVSERMKFSLHGKATSGLQTNFSQCFKQKQKQKKQGKL